MPKIADGYYFNSVLSAAASTCNVFIGTLTLTSDGGFRLKRLVDQAFERYLDYVDSSPGEANMRSSVHHEDGEWESYGWAAGSAVMQCL